MLTEQTREHSLIDRERRRHSAFRPPKFFKASLPQKKALTPTAQPWFPQRSMAEETCQSMRPKPDPPMALGHSPVQNPKLGIPSLPELNQLLPSPCSTGSLFSPLSTPVSTFFHTFSEEATSDRVYPVDMFMSVRKDASHTPLGVLKWCVRQYVEVPMLRVPPHLRLSMNEALHADDGVTRGALGSGLKSKVRSKPARQTHHKVMSVLSRITRAKYNELLEELLQLPLRQSDDAELQEVVKVFFDKSIQEHEFSDIYAQLVKELCTLRQSERELDSKLQERLLSNRMRHQLISACEEQFRRPIELTADEMVDRTTGTPFDAEEIEMKRTRMKDRLVGNIKFIGELYKLDLVTDHVVESILDLLVGGYSPAEPTAKEECVFEVFAMMIKTVAHILKERHPLMLTHFLGIAKRVELTHPRPRVRFLMMDLSDLNEKKGWIPADHILAEVTPSDCVNGMVSRGSTGGSTSKSPRIPVNRSASFGGDGISSSPSDSFRAGVLSQATASPLASFPPPHSPQLQQQRSCSVARHGPCGVSAPQQLPVCGSVSGSDLPFGLPRSRSSTASFQAVVANGDNVNANGSGSSGAMGTVAGSPVSSASVAPTPTAGSGILNTRGNGLYAHRSAGASAVLPLSSSTITAPGGKFFAVKDVNHSGRGLNVNPSNGLSSMNQSSQTLQIGFTPVEKRSPFTPVISASELSSARTSEGTRTPIAARPQRAGLVARYTNASVAVTEGDSVNLQDVTQQLMERFNDPSQAAAVIHCINDMALRNKVLCLTWWLRLVATNTALFVERQRVTCLLCELLSSCPGGVKPEELAAAVVEWVRFDIEQGLYDSCPRMFDNIAHMVLYCHSPDASKLPNIAAAREVLHAGLFNVMLHELTVGQGADQMVTLVKSAHPVAMAMMGSFVDPTKESAVLRLAVQNRFRLLPYFLSVSSGTESELPGTPGGVCRTPTTPSLRSPLGDSIANAIPYDPLSRCLAFPRVADDAELLLFRKIRASSRERSVEGGWGSNGAPTWQEEAVRLSQASVGSGSVVSQALQVMKVVGALLACTSVTHHSSSLVTFAEVDATVKEILARRPGTIFEAAAIVELMMHFTQVLNGARASTTRKSARIKPLRQALARWCSQGIVQKDPAMTLVRAMETTAPNPRVFTTYHNAIADAELQWGSTIMNL